MLLTLELLKKHVRAEDFDADDDYLAQCLAAAIEAATLYTHRAADELHALAADGADGGYPPSFGQAVLLLAATWYDQREAVGGQSQQPLPYGAEALLKPYRRLYAPTQATADAYVIA